MNFFEHQDAARKRTGWLVVLFALAVLGIIAAAYLVVAYVVVASRGGIEHAYSRRGPTMWDPELLGGIGTGVIVMVAAGTLYKLFELRAGGTAVAESLGGKLIEPGLADPQERKLLNVVEEMALASGTPVPPVYILPEEEGINAFAAGYTPGDAVIGVTQGAVQRLTRDELQGVIGHEFSHILNGDMRLNIRLIGILHGILVIGLVGYFILRSAFHSSRYRSRRSKGNPLPLIAIGIGLMVVGYIGTFFGKLIKAGVSRQREFLADASSVQFTRNPLGLTGALRKIGGLSRGSLLEAPNAETASHMFFGQGVPSWITFLFATHPDLKERIRRIDPMWDGTFISARIDAPPAQAWSREGVIPDGAFGVAPASTPRPLARAMSRRVALVSRSHLSHAAKLLEELPNELTAAAREPFSARAVVYALLINGDTNSRATQMKEIEAADPPAAQAVRALLKHTDVIRAHERLPLVDLAMPALRRLSAGQYEQFKRMVDALVRADGKIQLFEWMIERVVMWNIRQDFARTAPKRVRYYGLGQLTRECSVLISTLARAGASGPAAQKAFAAGAACLERVGPSLQLLPADQCRLSEVNSALEKLNETAPRIKQQLVDACASAILADVAVTVREAELLRAVCAALNCPMPPLVPGAGDDEEAVTTDRVTSARQ